VSSSSLTGDDPVAVQGAPTEIVIRTNVVVVVVPTATTPTTSRAAALRAVSRDPRAVSSVTARHGAVTSERRVAIATSTRAARRATD